MTWVMPPAPTPSAPSPQARSRLGGLTRPFAAVGLVGSAMVADLLFGPFGTTTPLAPLTPQFPESLRYSLAVIVSVTATCGLLGRWASRRGKGIFRSGFLLAGAVGIAGAIAGALSGGIAALTELVAASSSSSGETGFLIPGGIYLGLIFSAPFYLPLAAIYFTWRSTGEAREGSILSRSERERVWVVTTCMLALGALAAAALCTTSHTAHVALVAAGATGVLGLLTVVEARRLRGMIALVRGLVRIEHDVPADAEVDLGIGDERWMSGVTREAPYRGVERSERSVRGAVFDAQGRLTRAVLVDAGLFGACLVALLLLIAQRPPPPPVVSFASPPPPKPASTLPGAGVRWLSWYPLSPPLLVDIDGDGHEDIVGLRWNSGDEAHALSVTATSGATLAPLWQSTPIACQWANPQIRLLRSGDRLFLSDSEKLIHIYDLRTGHDVGEARAMPESTSMQCADVDADADPRVWLWEYPKSAAGKGGYLLDASGLASSKEPKWCVRPVAHPRCVTGAKGKAGAVEAASASATTACEADHDYRAPPIAPMFNERYALEEGDDAVAVGFRRTGDSWTTEVDALVGYDAKTHKILWDQPVARGGEAHAFPRTQVDLNDGKVFTFFQVKTGAWELAAREAHTGSALWSTEPPRAMEGTNFDSMTISAQGVYLGLSNRLEVFDPKTGGSRGVVW